MRKLLIALSFVICGSVMAQDYKTHKVSPGETLQEIAKKYMVTPFDIIALNPDAKTSLQPNAVLIIPKSRILDESVEVEEIQLVGYRSHKVKRKETLYGIAQKYNLSVDEIKKHNTRLYSENLRKGDKLQIPNYSKVKTTSNLGNTIKKYKVLPQEGKWRIAYKFGISVPELEALNPRMTDSLQVGEEINVPNIANNEERIIEETYGYYTVLPKEGFYRLKVKLGLDKDQLVALNPELENGELKNGMVLKVPLDASNNVEIADVNYTSLANEITNYDTKRLAVMIPFRLHRIDMDSIREVKDMIREDRLLGIALDFHSGVLMALDSAKQLGISTKLDVFDTEGRVSQVSSLITDNDFSQYDAVFGPFIGRNFDRAATMLRRNDTPLISPVSVPTELFDNVYQTVPSKQLLRQRIINHIKKDSLPHNIIVIADDKHRPESNVIRNEFGNVRQMFSERNKDEKEGFFILPDKLEAILEKGRTYVFLESENEGFVSNVTSMLNGFNGITIIESDDDDDEPEEIEREIILVTTDRNRAFEGDNVSNYHLSNLQFIFPSANRAYDFEQRNPFVENYKRLYRDAPSRYATRGFDLTMDILLRLASADDLYKASDNTLETQYVENKFRYSKKLFGGYYNEASFIVRYNDLKIVEVKE